MMTMPADIYIKPGFFTTRVFNPAVAFLARRIGLSMKGARVLSVRGRKTGAWHSTPVNPLGLAGRRYLVAPRGETQWVRNIRVSREARLTLGGRTETVHVEEVADVAKPPILRAYLAEWAWEVNQAPGLPHRSLVVDRRRLTRAGEVCILIVSAATPSRGRLRTKQKGEELWRPTSC
jgi:hypothetical protein